jgi:cell division protein FtsL
MKALAAILILAVAVGIEEKVDEFENLKAELKDLISKVESMEKENSMLKSKIEELARYEKETDLNLKLKKLEENVTVLKDELKDLSDKNGLKFYVPLCVVGFTAGFLLCYGVSELLRRR